MFWANNDIINMEIAIEMSRFNLKNNEVPVGVVLANKEGIIAKSNNSMIKNNNPIFHAEIDAINFAVKELNKKFLNDCDMYVTLEPCPMCAYAISLVKIGRVFIATTDSKFGGYTKLQLNDKSKILSNYIPKIYFGLMELEARKVINDFFKSKR